MMVPSRGEGRLMERRPARGEDGVQVRVQLSESWNGETGR